MYECLDCAWGIVAVKIVHEPVYDDGFGLPRLGIAVDGKGRNHAAFCPADPFYGGFVVEADVEDEQRNLVRFPAFGYLLGRG